MKRINRFKFRLTEFKVDAHLGIITYVIENAFTKMECTSKDKEHIVKDKIEKTIQRLNRGAK